MGRERAPLSASASDRWPFGHISVPILKRKSRPVPGAATLKSAPCSGGTVLVIHRPKAPTREGRGPNEHQNRDLPAGRLVNLLSMISAVITQDWSIDLILVSGI